MDHLELAVHGIAKGGDGVARESSGRVVFLPGSLPGDVVRARLIEQRKRFARGVVEEVLVRGPGRLDPPCRHLPDGCGGCDLQHATLDRQRELKVDIVGDALERIGGFGDPTIRVAGGVDGFGYRTSVRCAVVGGSTGFRRARSDGALATPDCLVVHPSVADLMGRLRLGPAEEVVIRVGARTGEALVVVTPNAEGIETTTIETEATRIEVVGADEVRAGRPAHVHEIAAGRRWQISAQSFFQSSPEAADLLVSTVQAQLNDVVGSGVLCDLYSGVGLFAGAIAHDGSVLAVEANAAASADAEVNLADRDATLVRESVDRWRPEPADIVVADPSRHGLGATAVQTVVGTGAATVVLVSCDPAAFARDARLLVDNGYAMAAVDMVDLFPQTSHVETVTRFDRVARH